MKLAIAGMLLVVGAGVATAQTTPGTSTAPGSSDSGTWDTACNAG